MPKTPFRAEIDGFAFANSWTFDDAERQVIQGIVRRAVETGLALAGPPGWVALALGAADSLSRISLPASYGLCGGMAFASLDYHRAELIVPRGRGPDDRPTRDTPEGAQLRDYLWRRLIDSLSLNAPTFLWWMFVGNNVPGGPGALRGWTLDEFHKLKQSIDRGQAVPIGLVGTTGDPTHNHQVVAYGYEDPGNGHVTVYVYDMNAPNAEQRIDIDFNVQGCLSARESVPNTDRGDLRAFFVEQYAPAPPPVAVGLSAGLTTSDALPAVNEIIQLSYRARNAAYCPAPPMTLWIAGRPTNGLTLSGENRDAGGEDLRVLTPLDVHAERALNVSHKIEGTLGPRALWSAAHLGVIAGVDVWRKIPPLAAGTRSPLFLTVRDTMGWVPMGGVITGRPVVARNADGRLEVFARGTDNALWHAWQVQPNGAWSGWQSLGGNVGPDVTATTNADGRIEVFVKDANNVVKHLYQRIPNGLWSGIEDLGGGVITGRLSVAKTSDGRIVVFGRGTDGAVWHTWQTAPNGGWSGWASLGGQIQGDPVGMTNADGRLEVFARGMDNALWHNFQGAPNGGWAGWQRSGGNMAGNPTVGVNGDGRLEIFFRGADNALWHTWQTAPSSGWSPIVSQGGVLQGDVIVGRNADGRLEAFVRGSDNAIWHKWQTYANPPWSEYASLGGVVHHDVSVANDQDGRLEIFAWGTDNSVFHRWQVAPNGNWD